MIITKKARLLAAPFVGSILTVNVGEDRIFKLRMATKSDESESIKVDWGDGTKEVFSKSLSEHEHLFPAAGEYQIRFSDDVEKFAIGTSDDTSEYATIYAPMVTGFFSNASCLWSIPLYGFRSCVNLARFDVRVAPITYIGGAAFRKCLSLEGELYFPSVKSVVGGAAQLPFAECPNITAIHFSAANRAAVVNGQAYSNDPTLGTEIDGICRFDL